MITKVALFKMILSLWFGGGIIIFCLNEIKHLKKEFVLHSEEKAQLKKEVRFYYIMMVSMVVLMTGIIWRLM